MAGLRVVLSLLLASCFVVGCGGTDPVDCGGAIEWETVEVVVSEVGPVRETDGQPAAEVTVDVGDGANRVISVWGQPGRLDVGQEYRFEVTQDGEAFFEYRGEPACAWPEFRRSVPIE